VEVNDDDHAAPDAVAKVPNEPAKQGAAVPNGLLDDPEIRQKMKELELVKLDNQLAELRGGPNANVAERLVLDRIDLLNVLLSTDKINKAAYCRLVSSCPWCGASSDIGLRYEDASEGGGYRCASCGHWVPY